MTQPGNREILDEVTDAINQASRYDSVSYYTLNAVQTPDYARVVAGQWAAIEDWPEGALDRRIEKRLAFQAALRRPELQGNVFHYEAALRRDVGRTVMVGTLRNLEDHIAEPPNGVKHYILPFELPNHQPYPMYSDGFVVTHPDGLKVWGPDVQPVPPGTEASYCIPALLDAYNGLVDDDVITREASLQVVRARIDELQS